MIVNIRVSKKRYDAKVWHTLFKRFWDIGTVFPSGKQGVGYAYIIESQCLNYGH